MSDLDGSTALRLVRFRAFTITVSVIAGLVFAASKIHIVKDVYPIHEKIVRVLVPSQQARDGQMTDAQCESLRSGTKVVQILDQYGLPKDGEPADEAHEGDGGTTTYPIKGTSRTCTLSFGYEHGLEHVTLELPLR